MPSPPQVHHRPSTGPPPVHGLKLGFRLMLLKLGNYLHQSAKCPPTVQQQSANGLPPVRHWSTTGPPSIRHRSTTSPHHRSATSPPLVYHWANILI